MSDDQTEVSDGRPDVTGTVGHIPPLDLEAIRTRTILAMPQWTLFRCGWLFEDGHVQGGIYYRLGDGLGPMSRDRTPGDMLRLAARWYAAQPGQQWGIEILAAPTS